MAPTKKGPGLFKRYGFLWITAGLFIFSLIGHLLFGWFAYVNEQIAHAQSVEVSDYVVQMSRDTFENWQSEFLQVIWQVAGLSFLLFVGSPQSKEGSERVEAKIDELLRALRKDEAEKLIGKLDREFHRTSE